MHILTAVALQMRQNTGIETLTNFCKICEQKNAYYFFAITVSHHILRGAGEEGLDVADDYLKQAGAGFSGGPGYVGSDEGIGLGQQGNAGPLASNS